MKVVMISTDRKIFKKGSDVRHRIIEYGQLSDELHVIVFALEKLGFKEEKLSRNVWIYPTNSSFKFSYITDAVRVGGNLLKGEKIKKRDTLVSTQDPFETGLAGLRLKKKHNVPLQVQIHTDFLSPYFGLESFINKLRVAIAGHVLPRADCIRVVSERIKASLTKYRLKSLPQVLPIYVPRQELCSQART